MHEQPEISGFSGLVAVLLVGFGLFNLASLIRFDGSSETGMHRVAFCTYFTASGLGMHISVGPHNGPIRGFRHGNTMTKVTMTMQVAVRTNSEIRSALVVIAGGFQGLKGKRLL